MLVWASTGKVDRLFSSAAIAVGVAVTLEIKQWRYEDVDQSRVAFMDPKGIRKDDWAAEVAEQRK
jgi:hypothetical protein